MADNKNNAKICREVLLELLPRLHRQISRDLADALRPHRMTPAQYSIVALLDTEGPLPPRRISSALSLDQSTVVNTLNRLQRDGFVSRHDDPDDGRSCLIKPTSEGQRIRKKCEKAVEGLMKDYSDNLSGSGWSKLLELVGKLEERLVRNADPT
ncbi:MarR family winged helix-turn-helix transcriptional regulator [Shimia biformata]|uniref:MarR family winged helix-turn-helix transcriptional regulator n=1 Tax=Shimia biformata TaxID=1294299 RepID=UPI00194F99A5|nr:MarR family transcriptional regulator [Shimia biformata]